MNAPLPPPPPTHNCPLQIVKCAHAVLREVHQNIVDMCTHQSGGGDMWEFVDKECYRTCRQ